MDFLSARNGTTRFVLIGLCSGAYMTFHTGLEDPRVVAQVMINPQTFEWHEGDSLDVNRKLEYKSFRFYLRAALREETWSRLIHGEVNRKGIFSELAMRGLTRMRTSLEQLLNSRFRENKILSNFKTLRSRKIQMLLIYSQEDPGLDELALHVGPDAQLLRPYRNFRFELIDGPDHTFTPVWSQRRLEEIITAYLVELTERPAD
jgi:pimeloyl-ACP methyl ester carboxylesterase